MKSPLTITEMRSQALGLGGHVRKGARGTTVVYADRFTPDDEPQRAAEAGEDPI